MNATQAAQSSFDPDREQLRIAQDAEDKTTLYSDRVLQAYISTRAKDPARASVFMEQLPSNTAREFDKRVRELQVTGGIDKAAPLVATSFVLRAPETVPPRAWLFRKHYVRKFPVCLAGAPGAAKSSVQLVDAVSMAIGRDLLNGDPIPDGPLRVWVYNLEDPDEEIERRIGAICKHWRITADDIGGRLFVNTARQRKITLAANIGGIATPTNVRAELIAAISANGIDVTMLDPLVHAHAVMESDNVQMGVVMDTARDIADATNSCIEVTHHIRKNGNQDVTAEDLRGASAILGAARSVRLVSTMSAVDAKAFGIGEEFRRFHLWVNPVGKSSMAPPLAHRHWYRLESIDLGNTPSGREPDTVGVTVRWIPPDPFAGISLDDSRRAWRAIQTADVSKRRESSQADGWVGKVVASALHLNPADGADRARILAMLKAWTHAGTLVPGSVPDKRQGREVGILTYASEEQVRDDDAEGSAF